MSKIRTDRVSETVRARVRELYAILATQAAQQAFNAVALERDHGEASFWVVVTEDWLIKSGANAARWTYDQPRKKT